MVRAKPLSHLASLVAERRRGGVEGTLIQLSAILAVVFSTSAQVSLSQFRQRYVYGFLCTMIILGLHMNT